MKNFNFKNLGNFNILDGQYIITYSPLNLGWYAELLWNGQISPVFTSSAKAKAWAIENGGTAETNGR